MRASGRRRRAGLSRLCDVVWRDVDGERGAARACWSADGSKESRRGSARGAQRERCASLRGEREGEEGGARAARRAPPRASHRAEGEERSAAMAGGGASRRPSRGSSAAEPAERGARVARRARPAIRGWLRSRRTAWWARTPRPSASRVEGRERRARRVRPLSLSLLVFVGARESSRGMPTRAPAALLRVRLRSSRTTACGRRRGVCSPRSLRLPPVPRLSHREIASYSMVTSNMQ